LPVRTHSLTRLYGLIESDIAIAVDQDMLDRLDAVYIESRYPGEMGLLPHGKPTQKEAKGFYTFARKFYKQVQDSLHIDEDVDPSEPEIT